MTVVLSRHAVANNGESGLDWGTIPEWITALFAGLALFVVSAAVSQLRLHNRQLHRELENEYLQRFWAIWDGRTQKFKRTGNIKHAGGPWIQDYLTLSSDQVELRERGRVTDDTWDFWARDIARFCLAHPELLREARRSYPALRQLLTSPGILHATTDRNAEVYDPLGWSRRKRKRQGLTG